MEESSFFYLLEASEAVSERFEEAVRATYAWILENPGSGALRELLSTRLTGLRVWPVLGFEKHLVFYRQNAGILEIVRVLHGACDIDQELAGGSGAT